MPLDSQTRVMSPPSVTVSGEASSEPRILGETVMRQDTKRGRSRVTEVEKSTVKVLQQNITMKNKFTPAVM